MITLIAVLSSALLGRADESTAPNYTKAELHKLVREAHSSEQYRALAKNFRAQQIKCQQQAQEEKAEVERRSLNVTGAAAKYPRPVDSSRNRYEYFTDEAGQMESQASRYENSLRAHSRHALIAQPVTGRFRNGLLERQAGLMNSLQFVYGSLMLPRILLLNARITPGIYENFPNPS